VGTKLFIGMLCALSASIVLCDSVSNCYVTDPVETSLCTEMFIGVLCARSASIVLCDSVIMCQIVTSLAQWRRVYRIVTSLAQWRHLCVVLLCR
jgi:hypothetical protein